MDKIMSSTMKKGYKTWRKSMSTPEMEKSIEVEEIDNGFIVTFRTYPMGEGESTCIKKYSETNPLAKEEPEIDSSMIDDFINPKIKLM